MSSHFVIYRVIAYNVIINTRGEYEWHEREATEKEPYM